MIVRSWEGRTEIRSSATTRVGSISTWSHECETSPARNESKPANFALAGLEALRLPKEYLTVLSLLPITVYVSLFATDLHTAHTQRLRHPTV
jgi:hypothetical protein